MFAVVVARCNGGGLLMVLGQHVVVVACRGCGGWLWLVDGVVVARGCGSIWVLVAVGCGCVWLAEGVAVCSGCGC